MQSSPLKFTALEVASGEEYSVDALVWAARELGVSGAGFAAPTVVTNSDFRFIVTEQLAQIEQSSLGILIEPEGRNTAPAVALAAIYCLPSAGQDPEDVWQVPPDNIMKVLHDANITKMALVTEADQ